MEGDSKVVVSWGLGRSDGLWQLAHYIREIRILMRDLDISLNQISRTQNEAEDKLARWGVGLFEDFKGNYMLDC